jgi:hypothetical protein
MSSPATYLRYSARMIFFFIAIVLSGVAGAVLIYSWTSVSVQVLPTVRCVYGALKSSPFIKSVNVYVIDNFRFGFEYAFKGKDGQRAVSYVELVAPGLDAQSAFLGDKIPREVSEHTMAEGQEITYDLQLSQKCHLQEAYDNLFPQPDARATWHPIELPNDFY